MKKWGLWGVSVVILALVAAFFQWPDSKLHIITCDVGQGDAILITHRFSQVLIDGGPNSRVTNCLSEFMPFWDRNLEMVVMTHPQDDHLRGLIDVMEQYQVGQLIANNTVNDTGSFWRFRVLVIGNGVPVHAPTRGETITVGELEFRVLWPEVALGDDLVWKIEGEANLLNPITMDQGGLSEGQNEVLGAYSGDLNEVSIVVKLVFEEVEALFTGDIGAREEQALLASGVITNMEILKVAHHGSKYSSSSEFLRAVEPELAIISVGRKNRFGHPASDTLMRLDTVGAKVLRTDEMGAVELITDGERIWW